MFSCHFYTVWCTESMEPVISRVAQQVWFTTAAAGEQELLVFISGNKNNNTEKDTEKGWLGLSQLTTIKSKCISCFDPRCNLHLFSANTFTANKAYWIILTVCGREEQWATENDREAAKWSEGMKSGREEVKTERWAKPWSKTQNGVSEREKGESNRDGERANCSPPCYNQYCSQTGSVRSESARLELGPQPIAPGPLVTHTNTHRHAWCQTCRPALLSPPAPSLTIVVQPNTLN